MPLWTTREKHGFHWFEWGMHKGIRQNFSGESLLNSDEWCHDSLSKHDGLLWIYDIEAYHLNSHEYKQTVLYWVGLRWAPNANNAKLMYATTDAPWIGVRKSRKYIYRDYSYLWKLHALLQPPFLIWQSYYLVWEACLNRNYRVCATSPLRI